MKRALAVGFSLLFKGHNQLELFKITKSISISIRVREGHCSVSEMYLSRAPFPVAYDTQFEWNWELIISHAMTYET